MSCSCEKIDPCAQDSCNCPPDYSVRPVGTNCNCCPEGTVYYGPTPNYANGYCKAPGSSEILLTIPCNQCEDALDSDCVIVSCEPISTAAPNAGVCFPCYGIKKGDSLTTVLKKIDNYCPSSYAAVNNILYEIANTPALAAIFCQLVAACSGGALTGTVPIITYVNMP